LVAGGAPGAAGARALADKFSEVSTLLEGDDAVLEVAVRDHALVVTADRDLSERLRAQGVTVLAPRDRHRLEVRPGDPARPARATPGARSPSKSPRRGRVRGNG
jgi:rRNA-processing protein FCF1